MEKRKKELFIFGLGHLARYIIDEFKDFKIEGTYRSLEKVKDFDVIKHFLSLPEFLLPEVKKKYDLIIFNIPPRENYKQLLIQAHQYFDEDTPWVFVSSTSVFGRGEIDESSPRVGESRNALQLKELEDYLMSLERLVSIIRPGGLISDSRRPENFFKNTQKSIIGNDEINLVHCQDVARFIRALYDQNLIGEHFNISYPTQVTKKEYYTSLGLSLNYSNSNLARRFNREKIQFFEFKNSL